MDPGLVLSKDQAPKTKEERMAMADVPYLLSATVLSWTWLYTRLGLGLGLGVLSGGWKD